MIKTGEEVIGYIARSFSEGEAKYLMRGNKLSCSSSFIQTTTPVIFCEDLLSSVKIGQFATGVPLFGTNLPRELLLKYRGRMYLWLDKDKQIDSVKQCMQYKALGINISPIITEDDPKEYLCKFQFSTLGV